MVFSISWGAGGDPVYVLEKSSIDRKEMHLEQFFLLFLV